MAKLSQDEGITQTGYTHVKWLLCFALSYTLLCSLHYKWRICNRRSTSAINPVTTDNMDDSHLEAIILYVQLVTQHYKERTIGEVHLHLPCKIPMIPVCKHKEAITHYCKSTLWTVSKKEWTQRSMFMMQCGTVK